MANEANKMFTNPVVYAVPGMEAVEVRRNLVYHTLDDGTELTMDVYVPPGEARPGVFFIHGGPIPPDKPWRLVKDWGLFTSYGRLMAACGMVGVTFNHRFPGFDRFEESAASIAAAFAFVRGQAASFHLDPDRLAGWALSGGGPFLGPLLTEKAPWIRCLVSYYAVLDLRPLSEQIPGGLPGEIVERFSPVSCLPLEGYDGPPILIARAGLDWPWINTGTDGFITRALAANAALDVLNHPRGQHGFDVLDDDARSREIIARTVDFLKGHL
ncbi:MAG TPA: alpha/beta hydrolase [Thermoanaerobaculia bacterium]|nr:alpha/beta hydrolase [Thermoanaerobaculia bacterium]